MKETLNYNPQSTIFTYFRPEAEIEFLKKIGDPEARVLYGRESLLKTLAEFAGKIPFDQIDFYFDGQNLYHPQIGRLRNGFSENDPREKADLAGLKKIENDFAQGANISFWVSPPTPGDNRYGSYSFLWVMVRDEQHPGLVREHIFRFDETGNGANRFNNFSQSTKVFTAILTQMARYQEIGAEPGGVINLRNEKDFLRSPLSFKVDDPKKILAPLVSNLLGKKMDDLNKKRDIFYKQILADPLVKTWLAEYLDYAEWLSSWQGDSSVNPSLYQPVYNYIQVIFNRVRALVRGENAAYEDDPAVSQPVTAAAAFDQYMGIVPGVEGGSCPASSAASSLDPSANVLRKVRVGGVSLFQVDTITNTSHSNKDEYTLHCHCPLCGAEVDATISDGKIHCPACGGEAPYKC